MLQPPVLEVVEGETKAGSNISGVSDSFYKFDQACGSQRLNIFSGKRRILDKRMGPSFCII